MSRTTEYQFVETDSAKILAQLISKYEEITNHTLKPGEPDRLFIAWVADIIINERVNQNYTGNQNIPSRAEGAYLDALGKWIFNLERSGAQAAKCTVRFNISAAQENSITVPIGTRVSGASQNLVWETTEDALIPIGETYVDVMVQCQTAGTIGNGYTEGQINALIDVDNILYFESCSNITVSDGGAEEQTDAEYFESMRMVADSYSTAGAEGSYIYWAKSVSSEIADVKPVCPNIMRNETPGIYYDADGNQFAFIGGDQIDIKTLKVYTEDFSVLLSPETDYTVSYIDGLITIALGANTAVATADKIGVNVLQRRAGYVYLYALMDDGTIASETIKEAIYDACSAESVRPLTDCVKVEDPEEVGYNIDFTYYISEDTQLTLTDIETAVTSAVNEYIAWQCAKLGRDINPDRLRYYLMQAGIKRMQIREPAFTSLRSGINNDVPQIATVANVSVTNGGYEDE